VRSKRFNKAWAALERKGRCDHKGGAEYRRVFTAYTNAGLPADAHRFIDQHANQASNTLFDVGPLVDAYLVAQQKKS
jgi:hypothetical protein